MANVKIGDITAETSAVDTDLIEIENAAGISKSMTRGDFLSSITNVTDNAVVPKIALVDDFPLALGYQLGVNKTHDQNFDVSRWSFLHGIDSATGNYNLTETAAEKVAGGIKASSDATGTNGDMLVATKYPQNIPTGVKVNFTLTHSSAADCDVGAIIAAAGSSSFYIVRALLATDDATTLQIIRVDEAGEAVVASALQTPAIRNVKSILVVERVGNVVTAYLEGNAAEAVTHTLLTLTTQTGYGFCSHRHGESVIVSNVVATFDDMVTSDYPTYYDLWEGTGQGVNLVKKSVRAGVRRDPVVYSPLINEVEYLSLTSPIKGAGSVVYAELGQTGLGSTYVFESLLEIATLGNDASIIISDTSELYIVVLTLVATNATTYTLNYWEDWNGTISNGNVGTFTVDDTLTKRLVKFTIAPNATAVDLTCDIMGGLTPLTYTTTNAFESITELVGFFAIGGTSDSSKVFYSNLYKTSDLTAASLSTEEINDQYASYHDSPKLAAYDPSKNISVSSGVAGLSDGVVSVGKNGSFSVFDEAVRALEHAHIPVLVASSATGTITLGSRQITGLAGALSSLEVGVERKYIAKFDDDKNNGGLIMPSSWIPVVVIDSNTLQMPFASWHTVSTKNVVVYEYTKTIINLIPGTVIESPSNSGFALTTGITLNGSGALIEGNMHMGRLHTDMHMINVTATGKLGIIANRDSNPRSIYDTTGTMSTSEGDYPSVNFQGLSSIQGCRANLIGDTGSGNHCSYGSLVINDCHSSNTINSEALHQRMIVSGSSARRFQLSSQNQFKDQLLYSGLMVSGCMFENVEPVEGAATEIYGVHTGGNVSGNNSYTDGQDTTYRFNFVNNIVRLITHRDIPITCISFGENSKLGYSHMNASGNLYEMVNLAGAAAKTNYHVPLDGGGSEDHYRIRYNPNTERNIESGALTSTGTTANITAMT